MATNAYLLGRKLVLRDGVRGGERGRAFSQNSRVGPREPVRPATDFVQVRLGR